MTWLGTCPNKLKTWAGPAVTESFEVRPELPPEDFKTSSVNKPSALYRWNITSTPLCSGSLHLPFPAAPHICLSECFPHRPQNLSYPPSPARAQTWPTYHPGQPIFSPLHHKQIGLLHLCLGPDCISLLIPHCLNILSSSLWHFQLPSSTLSHCPAPVWRLLPLHVCPHCLTAFTCQDWITSLFCTQTRTHTHTHTHTSTHARSSWKISAHTKNWDYRFSRMCSQTRSTTEDNINLINLGTDGASRAFLFVIAPRVKNCAGSKFINSWF